MTKEGEKLSFIEKLRARGGGGANAGGGGREFWSGRSTVRRTGRGRKWKGLGFREGVPLAVVAGRGHPGLTATRTPGPAGGRYSRTSRFAAVLLLTVPSLSSNPYPDPRAMPSMQRSGTLQTIPASRTTDARPSRLTVGFTDTAATGGFAVLLPFCAMRSSWRVYDKGRCSESMSGAGRASVNDSRGSHRTNW